MLQKVRIEVMGTDMGFDVRRKDKEQETDEVFFFSSFPFFLFLHLQSVVFPVIIRKF